VEELNIRLRNLHIEDMAERGREEKRKVSKPPIFNGERKELKGFLTIVNMNFEDTPDDFPDDRSKVRFITSFLRGDPLNWASNLWDNEDPLIDNLNNFKRELKINYGDPEVETIVANGKLDTIRQKKYGQVLEYINQFKTTCQNSDFNESAKIYMFLKGLHYKMREQLAVVNPNPDSLNKLYTDVIQIENLSKRTNLVEFYYNQQRVRNSQQNSNHNQRNSSRRDDPMDVDLFRIKNDRYRRYNQNYNQNLYVENKRDFSEEKKKGLCFLCKQPGHLQFNCPNRKRPSGVKHKNKIRETDENLPSAKLRRIRMIKESDDAQKIRAITDEENAMNKRKNNIITFYIKTNDIEEVPVRVLIDSGSDLNFIHPSFVNKNKIKLNEVKRSFNVTGLGYGISTIYEQTEKCILRFKNHFEVIQLYALYIPDVDIILGIPWIEKHCPMNYHDSRKISFPSGYCARNCNNGKRKRKNKNRSKKGSKKCKIDIEPEEENSYEPSTPYKCKPLWDSESESEAEYVRGRKVRTINDSDSDSDSDSINISVKDNDCSKEKINFCNFRELSTIDKIKKSCNFIKSCKNEILNKEKLEPLMIVIVIVLILVLKIMIVVKKKLTFVILKNLVQ